MANKQVKSRQRVVDHGEVFTSDREVNAMLDLVKQETERIDSRFLEPACGTGNFLIEILNRKLAIVSKRYKKSKSDYEKHALIAVTSIYGVDIQSDNIIECRDRLLSLFIKKYEKIFKEEIEKEYLNSIKFILNRNMLHGDALTMETIDGNPIIFSEWSIVTGDMIKRRDYRFDELLAGHEAQLSIFMDGWEYDEEIDAMIPAPLKEYPIMNYRRISYAE